MEWNIAFELLIFLVLGLMVLESMVLTTDDLPPLNFLSVSSELFFFRMVSLEKVAPFLLSAGRLISV